MGVDALFTGRSDGTRLFLLLLLLRALNAVLVRTTFAPDEWWQGPEVAHRMVFGRGHLTWEWAAGLRGAAHPSLYALPYWLLRTLRADTAWAVIVAPQLVQACFAACTDVYVARTARMLFGASAGSWALACQLASWFNAYALVRPYSNSVEACLTAAGVYHWLRARHALQRRGGACQAPRGHAAGAAASACGNQQAWLLLAGLCAVFRPSSALFWLLPAALEVGRAESAAARLRLAARGLATGAASLGAAALLDRWWYGRWVVVPWQFLRFNLLAGGSALYGSHPWHWNLTQGFPVVAGLTLLPLAVVGLCWRWGQQLDSTDRRSHWELACLVGWQLAVNSLPAHKEFRFLLPALQLAVPCCGAGAAHLAGRGAVASRASGGRSSGGHRTRGGKGAAGRQGRGTWWRRTPAACLALQVPMALYFCLFHHRGNVQVMHAIRHLAAQDPAATSVLFLTPCHATPYSTHTHTPPVRLRFLDCSPPGWAAAVEAQNAAQQGWLRLPAGCPGKGVAAGGGREQQQLSQRQCFELDSQTYLQRVLEDNAAEPPTVVVGYSATMQAVGGVLARNGYRHSRTWTNCLVQTDPDTPCSGPELWLRVEQ